MCKSASKSCVCKSCVQGSVCAKVVYKSLYVQDLCARVCVCKSVYAGVVCKSLCMQEFVCAKVVYTGVVCVCRGCVCRVISREDCHRINTDYQKKNLNKLYSSC